MSPDSGAANRAGKQTPFGTPVPQNQNGQPATSQRSQQTSLPPQPEAAPAAPQQSSDYATLIQQSHTAVGRGDLSGAMRLATQALSMDRTRPDPYSVIAVAALYRDGDVETAKQNYETAVQLGGTANFTLLHDHDGQFTDTCRGPLIITKTSVEFRPTNPAHTFKVPRNDIREAKMNKGIGRFIGSQIGRIKRGQREPAETGVMDAFHIKTMDGNYNFTGTSRTKRAEEDIILSLLRAK
jgi:hypothetical protein